MPRPRKPESPAPRFNSSPEVIRLVPLMKVRFPLSLRNMENLLFARGIGPCRKTVRLWWNKFGLMFAGEIRRQRVSRTPPARAAPALPRLGLARAWGRARPRRSGRDRSRSTPPALLSFGISVIVLEPDRMLARGGEVCATYRPQGWHELSCAEG